MVRSLTAVKFAILAMLGGAPFGLCPAVSGELPSSMQSAPAQVAAAPSETDAVRPSGDVRSITEDRVASRSIPQTEPPLGEPGRASATGVDWQIVLLQTALASRGCNRGAITGQLDEATRLAMAATVTSNRSSSEQAQPLTVPLYALRVIPNKGCPDLAGAPADVPKGKKSVASAPGTVKAAAHENERARRKSASSDARGKAKGNSAGPRQTASQGASFPRPMGISTF